MKKTGRIVIAGDTARGSFLNDLARNITDWRSITWTRPPSFWDRATGSRRPTSWNTRSSRNRTASWTSSTKRSFRCRDTFRRVTTPMPNRSAELKKVSKDV
ncbi:MAG: hypothetical protein ACLUEV_06725 [Alistipes sp.]